MKPEPMLILFDGDCNLCNGFIQFVIRNDKKGKLHFAPRTSVLAASTLQLNTQEARPETIVLLKGGSMYERSTAVLKILKELDGWWPVWSIFLFVSPRLRDWVYDWVAARRYRWFGKAESCLLPTPAVKARFLDGSFGKNS